MHLYSDQQERKEDERDVEKTVKKKKKILAKMALFESISGLNPLFYFDYNRLNSLLKRKKRTREDNLNVIAVLRSELIRVDRWFQEKLSALESRKSRLGPGSDELDVAGVVLEAQLLDEFVFLNQKAVRRIVERFDWLVDGGNANGTLLSLSPSFMSEKLALKRDTREWAQSFCGANLDSIDQQVQVRRPGDAMGWLGLFGGMVICLVALLIVNLSTMDAVSDPLWMPGHRVFRMFLLLSIYMFFIAVDAWIWSIVSVDWAFVFGIDQTRYLRARHYGLAAGQIATFTLVFANAFLFHIRISPGFNGGAEYWLLGIVLFNFLYLFNPLPFGHRSARIWLLRTLGRVIAAPFVGPVQFRDFWLADQFTSMVILLSDVGFTACFFAVDFARGQDMCSTTHLPLMRPFFAAFPFWLRLMQCLRRYYDNRNRRDLINAAKYFSSLLVILFAALHTFFEDDTWGPFRVVWCICAAIAMLFGFAWDVFMDWGLGRWEFKLLRRNLIFPKWCYYVAMPINLALRCAWLFTVAPSPFVGYVYEKALEFSLAAAEILRRCHWNLYRLANEHTQMQHQLRFVPDDLPADTFEFIPRSSESRRFKDSADDLIEPMVEGQPLLSAVDPINY